MSTQPTAFQNDPTFLANAKLLMQGVIDRHNDGVAAFYSAELKQLMSAANGSMPFSEAQAQVLAQMQANPLDHLWGFEMVNGLATGTVIDSGPYAPPAPPAVAAPPMSPVGNADPFVPGLFYANVKVAAGMPNGTKWTMDPRGTFVLGVSQTMFGNQYFWSQVA
jgi:hypothetical protein